MLFRKIEKTIEAYLRSDASKMLIIDGARQVGKSFIVRYVGKKLFQNFIEINMELDKNSNRLFAEARTTEDFYLAMSVTAGSSMKDKKSTLVFIDEIQAYPHLFTLTKFLVEEGRFTYIASGSLLGVTLQKTQSIPIGSIIRVQMYPLDFEEFMIANGVGELAIESMRKCFEKHTALSEQMHNKIMDLFKKYLLTGGMPDCVNIFLSEKNIVNIRKVQTDIFDMYGDDAAKYEKENGKRLKIERIYSLIPSNMENKKKRVVAKNIEDKKSARISGYQDEFDYLISSGVALEVKAVSQPVFPLVQNAGKNLLKLYMNDVGILSCLLYKNNIKAIMDDACSINLGSIYETVVAQELKAHGHNLYYYDNKQHGEVDYLTDDYKTMSVLPIEVKSGKDYSTHSALNNFLSVKDYHVSRAIVLSNERKCFEDNGIDYLPIYNVMFI